MSLALKFLGQQTRLLVFAGLLAVIGGLAIALPSRPVIAAMAVLFLAALTLVQPVGALLVLLLFSPLKALIDAEAVYTLPLDIGQIAFMLAFAAWAINRAALQRSLEIPFSRVQVPVVVFVAAATLSLPGAISANAALLELFKWAEMAALISLCLALFDQANSHWLVVALTLAGGSQAVIGIYQFFGGSGAEHLLILGNRFRAFGSFGQPNPFGAFMGITAPLAIASAIGYGLRLVKRIMQEQKLTGDIVSSGDLAGMLFFSISSMLIIIALVMSWSRGAWIGFAAAIGVMVFFLPRSLSLRITLSLAVIILGAFAWSEGIVPQAITERLVTFVGELTTITDIRGAYITDSNYAVNERIAHWQVALYIARDHPWLGVGLDNYELAYPVYALMEFREPLGHAHNYYMNLLAETGIIGLAAYLAAWGSVIVLTIWNSRFSQGLSRLWHIGLLGVWTYLLVHSLVDKLYVNNMFLHVGTALGLLAVLIRKPALEA